MPAKGKINAKGCSRVSIHQSSLFLFDEFFFELQKIVVMKFTEYPNRIPEFTAFILAGRRFPGIFQTSIASLVERIV